MHFGPKKKRRVYEEKFMKVGQTILYDQRYRLAMTWGEGKIYKRDEWINKIMNSINGRILYFSLNLFLLGTPSI